MIILWAKTAKLSFAEELDFIFKKWGNKEVEKFVALSEEFLQILKSGLIEGKASFNKEIRICVISKQTTLVYKINKPKTQIVLILFWNNLKNPKALKKILYK